MSPESMTLNSTKTEAIQDPMTFLEFVQEIKNYMAPEEREKIDTQWYEDMYHIYQNGYLAEEGLKEPSQNPYLHPDNSGPETL
ncbi:MAG: hypothetical protein WDZ42_01810 [Candidatus Saccharimonadales bacterium]